MAIEWTAGDTRPGGSENSQQLLGPPARIVSAGGARRSVLACTWLLGLLLAGCGADTLVSTTDVSLDVAAGTDAHAPDQLSGTDAGGAEVTPGDGGAGSDADAATDTDANSDAEAQSDGAEPDTPGPDSAETQTAETDITEPDAIATDAGATDALSSTDAFSTDVEGPDAADIDAGATDSGTPDGAGESDVAATDAAAESDIAAGGDSAEVGGTDAASGADAADKDTAGADASESDMEGTDASAADATSVDASNSDTSALDTTEADADGMTGSDAGTDTTNGPIACSANSACAPTGQVCDPLSKLCVACLWTSDCSANAECVEQVCQPITGCSNSLACTNAHNAQGQELPICDKAAGRCVACLGDLDCPESHVCVDNQCKPVVGCQNSKDCNADQVCDTNKGQCVQCLGNLDCASNQQCMDGSCVDSIACSSDKQCTPHGLLCDTSKGKCAVCLVHDDCPSIYHCAPTGVGGTGQCVLDVCQSGEARCDANQVVGCNAVGDDWALEQDCGASATCVQDAGTATCQSWICQPGPGCTEGKAIVCSADGLSVTSSIDCATDGGVCSAGQCKTLVCEPNSSWCSGQTREVCSADGLSIASATPCQQGTWCDAGSCKPQVCSPDSTVCEGQLVKTCDATGLAFTSNTTDCAAQNAVCKQGACQPILCSPTAKFCEAGQPKTCSADGTSASSDSPCQPGTWCQDGSCKPQICNPNGNVCVGQVAKTCDSTGLGYTSLGTDCAAQNALCQAGSCQPILCTPSSQFCSEGKLVTCGADGTSIASTADCQAGTYCSGSSCQTQICTPGTTSCAGQVVKTCDVTGLAYVAGGTDCAAQNAVCKAGSCAPVVCTPSAKFCLGGLLKTCSADGTAIAGSEACDANSFCAESGGSASCQPKLCTDSSAVCDGALATLCKADGSGYEPGGIDCAASGQICIQGACVACTVSGAETCDGQDNDCDGATDEDDGTPLCSGATVCQAKACVSGSCVETPTTSGTPCDDGTSCQVGKTCDGSGSCTGGKDRFFDRTYQPLTGTSATVQDIAELSDGSFVVNGDVGGGPSGLARLTRSGDVLWQVALPSPGYALGVHVDGADGIYVNMPLAVVKYDLTGNPLWTYTLPRRAAVLGLAEGGVYVLVRTESVKYCEVCAGNISSSCVNDGGDDLKLVKLAADGTVVSEKALPGILGTAKAAHNPNLLFLTPDGNLLAVLNYLGPCPFSEKGTLMLLSTQGSVLKSQLQSVPYDAYSVGMVNGKFMVADGSSRRLYDANLVASGLANYTDLRAAYSIDGDWFEGTRSNVAGPGGSYSVVTLKRNSPQGAVRWTKSWNLATLSKSMISLQIRATKSGVVMVGYVYANSEARSWIVSLDGWGNSTCAASGDCWTTPISACASCTLEVCDGTDNDCSGETDETGASPICDDGNDCTAQSCASGQCFTAALTSYACSDGDICTEGDVCQGTTCQSGSAKNCDDAKACTLDVCSPSAGCRHVPVPAPCP